VAAVDSLELSDGTVQPPQVDVDVDSVEESAAVSALDSVASVDADMSVPPSPFADCSPDSGGVKSLVP
jgi:hypothetical protein